MSEHKFFANIRKIIEVFNVVEGLIMILKFFDESEKVVKVVVLDEVLVNRNQSFGSYVDAM